MTKKKDPFNFTDLTDTLPVAENDAPVEEKYELESGGSFTVYKDDQFPFWKIRANQGVTPNKLSGSYTGRALAKRALEDYLRLNKMEVSKEA